MTLSDRLARLDALAQNATPGPWDPWDLSSWSPGDGDQTGMMRLDPYVAAENAAYIAACDPTTVRALVAVARAATQLDARFFDGQEDWAAITLPGEVDDLHDALEALEALP